MHTMHPRCSTAPPTMTDHLPMWHGWAVLPVPTQQYGGLMPAPRGFGVDVFIGAARDIGDHTTRELAAAMADCSDYQVTDPHGLAAVEVRLAALLGR
ncbi:hypothetical protein [Streptomyces caatingaensis]|uniref:DUF5753 domain-containing protein n=1 Tax=Streptomyces caatingaensis TaxID=1678637 RepID=A0A0K9XHS3_9ACTN|nr:hypothetical protein [Streptomyces caatingaensis]KNB52828.1 hypothetical protein AC230_09310 [Streptomyces caatingaensis]